MGSSIEAAICFSLILLLLTIFIVYPNKLRSECVRQAGTAVKEIEFRKKSEKVIDTRNIGGVDTVDTSPEQLNTMLNGIIDSIRIGSDAL
ncbi:MAG: hypothetical protein K6F83_07600 [Clostridiales bacterium]|nr:hypothetical protein [Clostridiales bacterium]